VEADRNEKKGIASKLKKAVNTWLEKLAKDNEATFGKGGLDCCQLNKQGKK
jgi:hypothetical protein